MVFLCCLQVDTKESRFDLVTEVDKACEDLLRSQVQVWWNKERGVWHNVFVGSSSSSPDVSYLFLLWSCVNIRV